MAKFICPNCDYVYDEVKGEPREGWPAGTPFADIDPDWCCPDCGVREQQDFEPLAGG
jgi:rubredoxin